MTDKISVVVISRNEGKELKRTVENFDDTLPGAGETDTPASRLGVPQQHLARGVVEAAGRGQPLAVRREGDGVDATLVPGMGPRPVADGQVTQT